MENVIAERVKGVKLTKAQMKIAEYIIANQEIAGRLSSLGVARAAGVSDVSVTRFARAIGYGGFPELKDDIYRHLAGSAAMGGALPLDERFDANRARFGSGLAREDFLKTQAYNLERTIMQNSPETCEAFVGAVLDAGTCFVVGFRGCGGTARQFAWNLRFLADDVCHIDDEGVGGIDQMRRASERDCAVIFSAKRYYKSDLRLARLAKEHGAKVCLITDGVLSPLAPLADVALTARVRQAGFFNSSTAMNALAEYLLTLMTPRRLERYRERARERDRFCEDLLI